MAADTDALLTLCLVLTVAAGGLKYRIRLNIAARKRTLAELKSERSRLAAQRQLVEHELAHAELKERELTNDCRELSRTLQDIQSKMAELERISDTRVRTRGHGTDPEGENTSDADAGPEPWPNPDQQDQQDPPPAADA